jgi:hypothetical protein
MFVSAGADCSGTRSVTQVVQVVTTDVRSCADAGLAAVQAAGDSHGEVKLHGQQRHADGPGGVRTRVERSTVALGNVSALSRHGASDLRATATGGTRASCRGVK